jgi:hypothetical protein
MKATFPIGKGDIDDLMTPPAPFPPTDHARITGKSRHSEVTT